MHLDLTDEETFALLNLLAETIENRYPLSPRLPKGRSDNDRFAIAEYAARWVPSPPPS